MDAFRLRREDLASDLRRVPVSPDVLRELMAACRDPDTSIGQVGTVVSKDPGLAARVLRIANASLPQRSRPVADIVEACLALGLREVSYVALAALVSSGFKDRLRAYDQAAAEFWQDSVHTALVAERLAARAGEPVSTAYTTGLLHQVGKYFVHWHFERWRLSSRLMEREKMALLRTEKTILGTDHAEITALVLADWHLPAEVVEAVRWQAYPEFAPETHRHAAVRLRDALVVAEAIRLGRATNRPLRELLPRDTLRMLDMIADRAATYRELLAA